MPHAHLLEALVYSTAFTTAIAFAIFASAIRLRPVLASTTGPEETLKSVLISATCMLAMLFALVTAFAWLQSLQGGTSIVNGVFLAIDVFVCTKLAGQLVEACPPGISAITARALPLLCGVVLGLLWLRYPSWITYEATAAVVACFALAVAPARRLRYLAIVLAAVMVYDVVSVLQTGAMVQMVLGGVEHPALGGAYPPFVFVVPRNFFAFAGSIRENMLALLAVADIVVPGLVVCAAARYGFAGSAAAGFVLGWFACEVTMRPSKNSFPASRELFHIAADKRDIEEALVLRASLFI